MLIFRIIYFFFLVSLTLTQLCVTNASAQPTPPSLRCISVESNGNVTLTWLAPADTGNTFGGYHIFSSSGIGGPFTHIDSIFNYATLTTTITNVNANNNTLYFFLKTREGCCVNYSAASDTLRTIRMIVTALSNERVRLNWNRTHTPPLPTSSSNFQVSKEINAGTYSVFRNLPDTTTLDTNYFCNRFINYKVTQADLSGCQSVSSIDGELFRDTKGPAQTLLDTISIDPLTGNVNITWLVDSSADTQGYVIYQFNGISYDSIGAVSGINTLTFTNTITNSESVVETYTVAAFDSCKNLGPLAVNHSTILLTSEVIKCEALLNLEWTPYVNIVDGLQRYEIWIREPGDPWILESIVPSNILNYEKQLLTPGATYEILVRAIGAQGQSASSNMISVVADILQQPSFLYIRSASVEGSAVKITCHVDPLGDTQAYLLYSAPSATGPFTLIESINYTPSSTLTFTDLNSDAGEARVFYRLSAYDSCGMEFVKSNVAGTVHLTALEGGEFISDLSWTTYTGWEYPPGSYRVFRILNGVTQSSPVTTVSGDTLFFVEDVSSVPADDGQICYVVMATEDSVNTFGFSDSAFSNPACVPLAPSSYIPNAFTPGGKNPVFKPVLLFNDPSKYSLQVFNRWGQLVFASESPGEGWDGTYNERDAPTGLYAYRLFYKGLNRKEFTKTGTVTLLR